MLQYHVLNFQLYCSNDIEMATIFCVFLDHPSYLLPFVILYLNAEVGGLSMRLKIKKKTNQNKSNKRKNKKKIKNCRQTGFRTTVACVESKDHNHWTIVSYGWLTDLKNIFCKFLFNLWETRSNNILRFLANSIFLNQQKGRGSLSVRKINLRSHKTSVSIFTQAICTGNF